jgi:hypothetical protein
MSTEYKRLKERQAFYRNASRRTDSRSRRLQTYHDSLLEIAQRELQAMTEVPRHQVHPAPQQKHQV